ncbi:flavodoxin family protein [Angustibacter peucedani]
MQAIVVHESFFGCTRAVADAVAQGLRSADPTAVVQVVTADDAPADLRDLDLLVVGSPTHGGRPSSVVSRWLQAQFWGDPVAPARRHRPHGRPVTRRSLGAWLAGPLRAREGLRAAAFDTRLPVAPTGGAAEEVARRLRRRGFVVDVEPQGFVVRGVRGPVADGELERAAAWGAALSRDRARAACRDDG